MAKTLQKSTGVVRTPGAARGQLDRMQIKRNQNNNFVEKSRMRGSREVSLAHQRPAVGRKKEHLPSPTEMQITYTRFTFIISYCFNYT